MQSLERKTVTVVGAFIIAFIGAYATAQSLKPKEPTNQTKAKQKHSNDEIADWIVSRGTFDSCEDEPCYPQFSTSISKAPDTCSLHVKTWELHDAGPDVRLREIVEYDLRLVAINPERIEPGNRGYGQYGQKYPLGSAVFFHTTESKKIVDTTKDTIHIYHGGDKDRDEPWDMGKVTTQESEGFFFAKDDETAKRIVNALKDLVTQCGGKPDKKEIY